MLKILIIGKSGRIDCIADALAKSAREKELYGFSEVMNPGLRKKCADVRTGNTSSKEEVIAYAHDIKPDFAIIGPEEPLEIGMVDALDEIGVPCVGPMQALAQLESSKTFTRELLSEYNIPGNPEYRVFKDHTGLESYLHRLGKFVVKPDGLTAGKGVKVYGEHLHSIEEAVSYCEDLFEKTGKGVVIEEKLDGQEFSLQSFCDGSHVIDAIPVQDHKRAHDGDTGPNTGGMGSYSCEDHCLPFLSKNQIKEASEINNKVAQALKIKIGEYKGILYGGFMATRNGIKVIEYNARFGDPEVMNVLPLLKTDFIDVCEAIIGGTLNEIDVLFEKKATVCKYVVPSGYPEAGEKGVRINDDALSPGDNLKVFYAAVDEKDDGLYLTGSRAIACVGIGNNLEEAEQIAEDAVSKIKGPVRHRKDIGTDELIQKKMDRMRKTLEGKESFTAA